MKVKTSNNGPERITNKTVSHTVCSTKEKSQPIKCLHFKTCADSRLLLAKINQTFLQCYVSYEKKKNLTFLAPVPISITAKRIRRTTNTVLSMAFLAVVKSKAHEQDTPGLVNVFLSVRISNNPSHLSTPVLWVMLSHWYS